MRVLVFCENRNAVRLVEILQGGNPDLEWAVCTAAAGGPVADWVRTESELRLTGVEIVDLAPQADLSGADTARSLHQLIDNTRPDRLVLFNDQSRRGTIVADASMGRVPRILIQDGHLDFDFAERTFGHNDQNFRYGGSQPDRICVWGPSMHSFLLGRSRLAPPDIRVTGALGISDDEVYRNASHRTAIAQREPHGSQLRVVLLDQPLPSHGKMPKESYETQVAELVDMLTDGIELVVKPHPSSDQAHIDWWRQFDLRILDEAQLVDANELSRFDLALSFFSSTYLETLRAQTPLIHHRMRDVPIRFPRVLHPLLRVTESVSELRSVVDLFRYGGTFQANVEGRPISHFVAEVDGVADVVGEVIRTAAIERSHAGTGRAVQPQPHRRQPRTTTQMVEEIAQGSLHPRSIAILGTDFSYNTGVAVSILTYAEWLSSHRSTRVTLIDVMACGGPAEIKRRVEEHEVVLVNGFAPLWKSGHVADAVADLLSEGRPVVVYAHETDYVFQVEAAARPARHRRLLTLLGQLRILCVSEAQRGMLTGLGAVDCPVVLECPPGEPVASRTRDLDGPIRVLMVGTIQARKGVELFSRVADLARKAGLDWEFRWIGSATANAESAYRSDLVQWAGPRSRASTRSELADADVFFLSSIDDPMPLSVMEAVQQRLRVVTYSRVGSSEILSGVGGYIAFSSYSPQAALEALRLAVAAEVDEHAYAKLISVLSPDAFASRMAAALAFPFASLTTDRDEPVVTRPRPTPQQFSSLIDAGDLDGALILGRMMTELGTGGFDVSIQLARIERDAGHRGAALAALSRAGAQAGDNALRWVAIADEADLLGESALALLAATTALERNPRSNVARRHVERHLASAGSRERRPKSRRWVRRARRRVRRLIDATRSSARRTVT